LAGAIGVGWWMGKERQPANPAPAVVSQPAAPAGGGDAKPALPASAVVGAADPFAALSCQPRQYNDTLALAVTFTQPVDAKSDLDSFLQVTDTGSASDKDSESAASNGDQPASVRPGDSAPKGKILKGNWVVGDNPRMVYFPYVQPQRSYAISVRAGLPGAGGIVELRGEHAGHAAVVLFRQPRRGAAGRPEWRPARGHGERVRSGRAVPARIA
jgi:hypothetical protein